MFLNKCVCIVALLVTSYSGINAQTKMAAPAPATSDVEKPAQDHLMLQFTYENWTNVPDSIKVGGLSRGFNGYLCYDFPIQNSNFSFAAGIGVGTSNIFIQNQELILTDTGADAGVRFVPESRDFKKYKLTTAYLEAPFEIRFFGNKLNRNKGFKAALGFRVGTLVGAHTKSKYSIGGSKVNEKFNTRRFMETWRFAGTVRVGYGNFSLFGSYNLGPLFKENSGPQVTPYSVGICISGL